jgi:hypothetical protein
VSHLPCIVAWFAGPELCFLALLAYILTTAVRCTGALLPLLLLRRPPAAVCHIAAAVSPTTLAGVCSVFATDALLDLLRELLIEVCKCPSRTPACIQLASCVSVSGTHPQCSMGGGLYRSVHP